MKGPPVVALYVERKGSYFRLLPSTHCWDAWRDAANYAGPFPVVAHPPCGPWGRLRKFCTKQNPELGRIAVAQVREFGGVLEHPAFSGLWNDQRLPRPGEFLDSFGGWTLPVRQVDYGHKAVKETWLYIVGVERAHFFSCSLWLDRPAPKTPSHMVSSSRGKNHLLKLSSEGARRTPVPFARFLISLAQMANGA